MSKTLALGIGDRSHVAEARRSTETLARSLGFNETEIGAAAIIASEMARNLVAHATSDEQLLLRRLICADAAGIELLALDKGPGIANIAQTLRDGYSTAGTPGTGLGAVQRLSTVFDIYSAAGAGTALLAQLWAGTAGQPPSCPLEIGAVCVPMPGEDSPGDGWSAHTGPERSLLLVVDGLGHGVDAATAASEALKAFASQRHLGPGQMIEAIHAALRSTRGAAAAVAELDAQRNEVRCAGIGNISALVVSEDASHAMVSQHGTLGGEVRRVQEFTYPWPKDALVVMHSDGLSAQWNLERYPGLAAKHPSLVAGVLYRDFARGRDDATVVVARAPD